MQEFSFIPFAFDVALLIFLFLLSTSQLVFFFFLYACVFVTYGISPITVLPGYFMYRLKKITKLTECNRICNLPLA